MSEKIGIIGLRLIVLLFFFRIGVTAIESMSFFLFLVSIGLVILYINLPKIIKS